VAVERNPGLRQGTGQPRRPWGRGPIIGTSEPEGATRAEVRVRETQSGMPRIPLTCPPGSTTSLTVTIARPGSGRSVHLELTSSAADREHLEHLGLT